ncbi:MAG: disulfide bond formation protein B [Geminicoccaceae bacterium]|jgi:disulfide bond formation protein DsbB
MSTAAFARGLNAFGLLAVTLVLATALLLQLTGHELPCPLCLLQREGLIAVGFGMLLNVRFGPAPLHYGLVLLGSLFGAAAAGRQILLHIVPRSGGHGSALMGLHLYTWCLMLFVALIVLTAVMLLLEGQFERTRAVATVGWQKLMIGLYLGVTVLVGVSAFVECGPGECPENPTSYWLLSRSR